MRLAVDTTAISPNHAAGVELFTYGLLNGLAAASSDPVAVTVQAGSVDHWRTQVPGDRVSWTEKSLPLRTVTPLGQRLRRSTPVWLRDSRAVRTGFNLLRHRSVDQHETADVVLFPSSTRPIPRVPSVLVLHDLRSFSDAFRAAGLAAVTRRNVARASAIVVTWPHPYQQALRIFPEAADRIALIPTPAFQPADRSASKPEAGLLIYPSSTASHKNHATLLEAMTMLPECRLVCPGPLIEPDASRLRARAAQPDLHGRVSFPGFITSTELADLYARADAVVVPSLWEAASGAMLEAFSWGLPVVYANVEPLRAQVEFTGGEAIAFEPQHPESLAQAVRATLAERPRYATASRLAGDRLGERTWQATGRDYLDLLAWVAGGQTGPIPRSEFANRLAGDAA